MTIFTGLMPKVHGLLDSSVDIHRHNKLGAKIPTLAELLKRQGYLTAGFYERGALWPELGFERGFDFYDENSHVWGGLLSRNARRFDPLRQLLRLGKLEKKPVFLFLHHYICHDPYLRAPQATVDKFLTEKADGLTSGRKDFAAGISDKERRPIFWKNADPRNLSHRRHMTALYDASINYSDLLFEEVIKVLKEEGFYDGSFIVLLSDHGEEFGEHAGWVHGRLFVEHLHVPLMIKFPHQSQGGRRISEPVRLIDVMPTLFDGLGIEKERRMQGVSLMPLLSGGARGQRPPIVSYSCDLERAWLLDGGFVYSDNGGAGGEGLFDHNADFSEQNDLSDAQPLLL